MYVLQYMLLQRLIEIPISKDTILILKKIIKPSHTIIFDLNVLSLTYNTSMVLSD